MMRLIFCLIAFGIASPASAELIFFSTQRSMSVASHRVEGDRLIVILRGGGEMTFDRALVTNIAPDEVPYPENRDEAPAATIAAAPAQGSGLANKTSYDPIIERASGRHGVDARIV